MKEREREIEVTLEGCDCIKDGRKRAKSEVLKVAIKVHITRLSSSSCHFINNINSDCRTITG